MAVQGLDRTDRAALSRVDAFAPSFAGFRWVFELPRDRIFDELLVFALRDAFASVAQPHTRSMDTRT